MCGQAQPAVQPEPEEAAIATALDGLTRSVATAGSTRTLIGSALPGSRASISAGRWVR